MNIAQSVYQRLRNTAEAAGRPFDELLQYYAMERFVYRLSASPHADKFVLKGAILFSVWNIADYRATRDIDFLGRMSNSIDAVGSVVRDICMQAVEPDGMSFDEKTITVARIAEAAEYEGLRVRLKGNLGNARVTIQLDIGFGDAVVPGPQKAVYPVILDASGPTVAVYTRESLIAEKFHTMVRHGLLNSRMKDFYDLWLLSSICNFDGETLAEAIRATFETRGTAVVTEPVVFQASFAGQGDGEVQWRAFITRSRLMDAPGSLAEVLTQLRAFLHPVVSAVAIGTTFRKRWVAPGPWR